MARVLIVDDEIETCNMLKDHLSAKGYEVYIAPDGKRAVELVKEIRPHVVLLDIVLPGMGGMQALKEIKEYDPTVGVIMVTAIDDEAMAAEALDLGAYDYITKPMNLVYIENVVTRKINELLA
jgi:DNA-binding response OmpR family regulator